MIQEELEHRITSCARAGCRHDDEAARWISETAAAVEPFRHRGHRLARSRRKHHAGQRRTLPADDRSCGRQHRGDRLHWPGDWNRSERALAFDNAGAQSRRATGALQRWRHRIAVGRWPRLRNRGHRRFSAVFEVFPAPSPPRSSMQRRSTPGPAGSTTTSV